MERQGTPSASSPKRARLGVATPGGTAVTADMVERLADAVAQGDLAPALSLGPGSRLQVLWCLDDEDVWWDCILLG